MVGHRNCYSIHGLSICIGIVGELQPTFYDYIPVSFTACVYAPVIVLHHQNGVHKFFVSCRESLFMM